MVTELLVGYESLIYSLRNCHEILSFRALCSVKVVSFCIRRTFYLVPKMLSLPLSLTDGRADCFFWLACWASGSGWISETVVVGDVGDVRVIVVVVVVELWVGSRLSDGIPWFRISGAYCKKIDSHILPRACFNLLGCLLIDICRFFYNYFKYRLYTCQVYYSLHVLSAKFLQPLPLSTALDFPDIFAILLGDTGTAGRRCLRDKRPTTWSR